LEAPLALPEQRAENNEVWALFTRGYFHEIATAAAEGKIGYAGSGLVRWAIILALTEQLSVMDTYLTHLSEDPGEGSGLGWVWPQANYVSGVTLHLQKSGPERRQQFERQSRKRNRAVNLVFESGIDAANTKVRASLFFKGDRRIESRPREIAFEVETLRV